MTPEKFFNNSVVSVQRFDLIMIEPLYLTIPLVETAMAHLSEGGALILTDTNPAAAATGTTTPRAPINEKKADVLLSLRRRIDYDVATVDVDGGISIVFGRRNSAILDIPLETAPASTGAGTDVAANSGGKITGGQSISATSSSATTGNTAAETVSNEAVQQASHQNDVQLHLMRFEDVHEWLASTGNVDAVTAFGGEKALSIFKESEKYQQKCSAHASDVTAQDRALACFQGEY
jgi:hypothetical protein